MAKNEAAADAAKPGRKPRPPYVPVNLHAPVACVVTQTDKGAKVELFNDPTVAHTRANELASKGVEAVTFGPQLAIYTPAQVHVEQFKLPQNRAPDDEFDAGEQTFGA